MDGRVRGGGWLLSNQEDGNCRQCSEVYRGRREGDCTVLGWAQDVGWGIGDVTLGGPRGFIRDDLRVCRNMKLAKVVTVIVKRREERKRVSVRDIITVVVDLDVGGKAVCLFVS